MMLHVNVANVAHACVWLYKSRVVSITKIQNVKVKTYMPYIPKSNIIRLQVS